MVALVKQQQAQDGADLLSQYRATGSPDVFAQIMRAYGGMVFSVCLKVTKVPADAEDASQATFLTLAVQCKTGANITYLGPWLKKVAKRTALDLVRSRKRRTRRESITAENRPEFFAERPGASSENAEISQIIRQELDQLPAKYRMPLVLHYFGGLSHDQISQEMRCTTAALGVRLHRARKMLGKRLSARGINLERGALGAAIAVAIQQVITDRFVQSTQQATLAMAWAHPSSAVATLPYHLGDINALVAQVASSMSRARGRMAAMAMAAGITMIGGAAEAVRHLPESIRPKLEFLAPSKAIGNFFERMTLPQLRADRSSEETTNRPAVALNQPTRQKLDDDAYTSPSLSAGLPIAPPTLNSSNKQPTLSAIVPTPVARPPVSPPGPLSPSPYRTHSQDDSAVQTRTVVIRDHATQQAPVPIGQDRPAHASTSFSNSAGSDGGSSGDKPAANPTAAKLPPPPMSMSVATSDQKKRSFSSIGPETSGGGGSSFNVVPPQSSIEPFNAWLTQEHNLVYHAGPVVPDFSSTTLLAGMTLNLDSGDRLIRPGDGTYHWDNPNAGIVTGGANSATVSFDDVTGGGLLSIEFLSPRTALAPARPNGHTFIGIWSFDTTFDYDAVTLDVRYDDLLAESLGLNEKVLKLWVYSDNRWIRIVGDTFWRDLDEHTLHGTFSNGKIDFFAVSAPEPMGFFTFAVAGAATLLRRRRRTN